MSMILQQGLQGITLIPSSVPMNAPLPIPAPPPPPVMLPPAPIAIPEPIPPSAMVPDDMSLILQNAQAMQPSRLSIGNILGGIAGAAGGFITGGVGGAIVGGVQGFQGTPKPKPGVGVSGGIQIGGTSIGGSFGMTVASSKAAACGMRGYHLDKKTHSKWVKNRHMNPGNGRAAGRAITRIRAAERQYKRIFRIVHGKKPGRLVPKSRRGRR